MPNEEMGSRRLPQPPDVATGIVIAAVAGFLAFVALVDDRAFFLPEIQRAGCVQAGGRTSISRADAAEKAARRSQAVRTRTA